MTGIGTALTALIKGSMVLTGKLCGCITNTGRLAWDSASADPEATAARQVKADAAAQQKALKARGKNNQDDEEDLSEVTAPPVPTVRRPALEALGVFALGGALAVGALTAAWRLLSPAASQWWASAEPYHYLITTGIGLAWMVAAWMLALPRARPTRLTRSRSTTRSTAWRTRPTGAPSSCGTSYRHSPARSQQAAPDSTST